MTAKLLTLLAFALIACADHRGEAGHYCKPDGTCISEHLECVNLLWGGLPVDEPYCRVKVKR